MDNIFREIEGSASVAFFHEDNRNLVLSTNTGSSSISIVRKFLYLLLKDLS